MLIMKNQRNKKQLFAVLAILATGAILAGFLVLGGKPGHGDGHDDHGSHEEVAHGSEKAGSAAAGKAAAEAGSDGHDERGHGHGPEASAGTPALAGAGTAGQEKHAGVDNHGGGKDSHAGNHEEPGKDSHAGRAASQPAAAGQAGTDTRHEEKIALSDEQIRAAGIVVDKAGPGTIYRSLTVPGQIRFNEDRTAHVVPRLAGVVDSVSASLGQQVGRGQVLAVIASTSLSELRSELLSAQRRLELATLTAERERKLWQEKISAEQDYLQARQAQQEADIAVRNARQKLAALGAAPGNARSLSHFEVRAPFSGTVMEKHIALGEAVKEDASIFTISDLTEVWAEVDVGAGNIDAVRVGEKVMVKAAASGASAQGRIAYVGSLIGEQTRTAKARIVLANPNGAWRPGLFVTVEIIVGRSAAALTVLADAIHSIEDKPSVFMRVPGGFVARSVAIGARDAQRVEILGGLEQGAQYAAGGSFTVKSELGKASAEHAH